MIKTIDLFFIILLFLLVQIYFIREEYHLQKLLESLNISSSDTNLFK